eukprot:COSAG02_NODE_12060_length_1605_cov_1.693227_1_plen_175_part_10
MANVGATKPGASEGPQAHRIESLSSRWRVFVVLAGLGVGAITDGPQQRVRELCEYTAAWDSAFCSWEEGTRVNVVLAFAACFFLLDVIVSVLAATPSWIQDLRGGICAVYTELRRCWRRRRRRQAREMEKIEQRKSREAALENDRRMKRLAELEATITADAIKKYHPKVRGRKGI